MKKKIYIEMDSVLGEISIHHSSHNKTKTYSNIEIWKISMFDWVKFEDILLNVSQREEAQDEDFRGWVPYDKFLKAKELYEKH